MDKSKERMPFGYNNETEKEIVQFIFQKQHDYMEHPPKTLVDVVIEKYENEGKAITYEKAEKEVSHYSIMRFILSEIHSKWGYYFNDDNRDGYPVELIHALHSVKDGSIMDDNLCECYIGVYWDYENSELMTRKDLEELINSNSYHTCTREQYCDRNFYTGLEKFDFCPKCGKKIDWDAIRENR